MRAHFITHFRMTEKLSVAVVGATGLVGDAVLEILASRQFPLEQLYVLASENSAGSPVEFNSKSYRVGELSRFDFAKVQLAIFCVPARVAALHVPRARQAGCMVIDHSSQFRLDSAVPLVIPEINPEQLEGIGPGGLVACPDSATAQLLLTVYPIYQEVGIRRIDLTTCLPVSTAGKVGVEELSSQTIAILNLKAVHPKHFPQQIAFNLLMPGTETHGLSYLEAQLISETQKILGAPDIQINPWHIQVPVFFGQSQVLLVETKEEISAGRVQELLSNFAGIKLADADEPLLPTPVTDGAQTGDLIVSRLRALNMQEPGIGFYSVADNIRRGAALGSVQIAEILVKGYL